VGAFLRFSMPLRGPGRRLPWSQIHSRSANVLVSWLEGAPRDNVHPETQKLLEVLEQTDVIKQRSARLEVD
jgi:hypothetical protein